jgi:hypothetical protein
MTKVLKQTNIILLFKLLVLSFIFCLPKAPASFEQDNYFSKTTSSKINSFILPSNVHFEHKVLKKIPLLESTLPIVSLNFTPQFTTLANSTPSYTHSKTSHFINSSFARGPPLHS